MAKADASGALVWRYEEESAPGLYSNLRSYAVDDAGDYYAVGTRGRDLNESFVVKVRGSDGIVLWRTAATAINERFIFTDVFLRKDGLVSVLCSHSVGTGAFTRELRAFSATTGQQRGVITLSVPFSSPQILPNGDIVGRSEGLTLVRIRPNTGAVIWQKALPAPDPYSRQIDSIVIGKNGEIFVRGSRLRVDRYRSELARIRSTDGEEMWSFYETLNGSAPLVSVNSSSETYATYQYVSGDSSIVRVLRLAPATGKPLWTRDVTDPATPNSFSSRLITATDDGRVFVATRSGGTFTNPVSAIGLYAFSALNGALKYGNVHVPTSPVIESPLAQGITPAGKMMVAGVMGRANGHFYATYVSRLGDGARLSTNVFSRKGPVFNEAVSAIDQGLLLITGRTPFSWAFQGLDKNGATLWQTTLRRSNASTLLGFYTPAYVRSVAGYRNPWGGPENDLFVLGSLETYNDLVAINGSNGSVLWRKSLYEAQVPADRITVSGANPNLFVVGNHASTYNPVLSSLDRTTGNVLWTREMTEFAQQSVSELLSMPDGNLLLVTGLSAAKIASADGSVLWTANLPGNPAYSRSIRFEGNSLYLQSAVNGMNALVRISQATGNRFWTKDFSTTDTPYLSDIMTSRQGKLAVIVGSENAKQFALKLDAVTGSELSRIELPPLADADSYYRALTLTSDGNGYLAGACYTREPIYEDQTGSGIIRRLDFGGKKVAWTKQFSGGERTNSQAVAINLDASENAIVSGHLGILGGNVMASALFTICYKKG
ncbi:MAG: PQQ-binding-like beta-propeller repeat protein [Fimbriimonas sp.]